MAAGNESGSTSTFDPAALGPIPASFEDGTPANVENAVGLGCRARRKGDWVELLCYNKDGTGGHPVRARLPPLGLSGETTVELPGVDGGAPTAMREILPEESGMMHVVFPWKQGYSADGSIEWTDTRYLLHISGEDAKLGWDVTVALRKACATLEQDAHTLLQRVAKPGTPEAPTAAELKKLPHFGRCQPAGFGSWALTTTDLTTAGDGSTRNLKAALEMVWVDFAGKTTRAAIGSVQFFPQKLSIPRLVAFDYDQDGRDEAVITYELEGTAEAAPQTLSPIWTFDGTNVTPYSKAPGLGAGGITVEQLENDMRPDLGGYGPFVAWLSPACGAAKCPDRITGPHLFAHADKTGGFSLDDEAALGAARRACPAKPTTVIATSAAGFNLSRTAQNVACARLWKVDTATIAAELDGNRDKLCGDATDCEALGALRRWAAAEPPVVLEK